MYRVSNGSDHREEITPIMATSERLSPSRDQNAASSTYVPSSMLQSQSACAASLKHSQYSQQSSQPAATGQSEANNLRSSSSDVTGAGSEDHHLDNSVNCFDVSLVEAHSPARTTHPGSRCSLPVPTPSLCLHSVSVSSSRACRPLTRLLPA